MNKCSNAIKVLNSTDPIHKLLGLYLTTNSNGETVLNFEKIAPIPSYLKVTPTGPIRPVPEGLRTEDMPEADLQLVRDYLKRDRLRMEALKEWLAAYWGFDRRTENCHVNDICIEFCTHECPPKPIVTKLARLSGHVLRLTYRAESLIGEFIAYPNAEKLTVQFEDLDRAPKWLRRELGYQSEDIT